MRRAGDGAVLAAGLSLLWASAGPGAIAGSVASPGGMAQISGGRYLPLYRPPLTPGRRTRRPGAVTVPPFELDRCPVTNRQYLEFVTAHPEWRRSRVSRLYADASYLHHWRGDLDLGMAAPPASPVVYVSWFGARAYCAAAGKRLPTLAEWELVAKADATRRDASGDPAFLDQLLAWYGRPTLAVLPGVGRGTPNAWGVSDMHGLVWEWTLDFNSALVSGESRGDGSLERSLYCGGGGSNAADFSNYAAFMRFAFRASLEARYTTANLGFRGARDVIVPAGSAR